MKILNQIRSTWLCFRASRYQGSKQFEKVIELGLKANELTPNDEQVATILYSGYSSSLQWEKAKDIAHKCLTIGDPYDVSWNKRMITSLCHLDSPIDELRPYLYAYVEGRSKINWNFSTAIP